MQSGLTFITDGEVMSDDSPVSPEPWAVPSPSSAQSAPPPSTGLPPTGPGAAPPPPTLPTPAPPWRRAGLVAAAVGAAAVLAGGGYLAGVALSQGSHSTTLTSAEGSTGGSGRAAGGQGVPGVPGAQDGAAGRGGHGDGDLAVGGITAGVITSATGDTLVLQTRQGQAVTVHASGSTTVRGASADSIDDLAVGDVILVAGARADDGSITATQILTGPPGGGGDRLAPNGTAPNGSDDSSDGDDGGATTGDQVHRVTT